MNADNIDVRSLAAADVAACSDILYALPEWFGVDVANRAYIDSLRVLPGAVAVSDSQVVGFIALIEHSPASYEIHVMGVSIPHHHRGVGTLPVRWAEAWCRVRDVAWLHVKTRGPSTYDEPYERTRRFYVACGFVPLFESLTHWGPEDAALVLAKHVACSAPRP